MLDRPILFVATADPDAAREFYEQKLGFTLLSDEPFALVFDAQGTTLRVQKVEEVKPPPYTVLGWSVGDVEATVREFTDRGVSFERYAHMEQDDLGIWHIPGANVGVAWFCDPAGHILSVTG